MKRKFFSILFILILIGAGQLLASPQKDEDFGIWSQNDVEVKLGERWKMKAGEELRFREHAGITYYDSHIGAAFQAWKHLAVGGDYFQVRQTRTLGKKDIWYWEERPRIYAALSTKVEGFTLEDRSLFEFRFKENTEDSTRYRNLVTLTAPWKWTRYELQPYTANELFLETNRNGLVEDRLYGGVKGHLWRQLYGSLFYLRQFSKNSAAKWKESNIVGIGLKVSL